VKFRRTLEIERAAVNAETGEFPATLFTDGEASDGHILNVAGGSSPARIPLFANHYADPTFTLGSLRAPVKDEHRIRYTGQIELGAPDGAMTDVRRDVLFMIGAGHLNALSGRWDAEPKDVVYRTELPKTHPAYVDPSVEVNPRKKYGLYFKKWRALEGSIVGLGADPKALIGRALEAATPDAARLFWRDFAQVAEATPASALEERFGELRLAVQVARGEGAELSDVVNALEGILDAGAIGELVKVERDGATVWLPRAIAAALQSERTAFGEARAALDAALSDFKAARTEGELLEVELADDATGIEVDPDARAATPEIPRPTVADLPVDVFLGRFAEVMQQAVGGAVRSALGRVS
jgi:hypothetical protein